ncbi:glycosyltransferase family 4 protein [Thalassobellus sediminis]|uniref:glycosyltransferase family 4 protein n=1 Tax=Thalassobellus sediminis TaxID=3367753 RepID=UPI0037AC4E33
MIKILYIGNQLSQKGKTETTIDTLSKSLKLEGYHVLTASKINNKVLRLLDMLFHIFKYRKLVHYVLIDTYSTQNFYYAYLCSQLCRFLKLKYIPILHGGNLPMRLQKNPKLSQKIFNNAYKNITPSEYIQSEFKKQGFNNLLCIPNSIELKNYSFKERVFDKPKLLWVRSFSEIYNPLLAIDVLSLLLKEGFEASLCMVGPENDGSLKKAKEHALKLNIDVQFTGKLSKKEWIHLSKSHNVFINTTNFDNMPVSVIEAMALGLPIVSTFVGGMPFLIDHKKEGILVDPNNINEFFKALKDIFDNTEDTITRVLKAREKVENYDWEVVKQKWFSVLQ